MADYTRSNNSIHNPLNRGNCQITECPLCKKSLNKDEVYQLRLDIWSGNPCTQDPNKKGLNIFACGSCSSKIKKSVIQFLHKNRTKEKVCDTQPEMSPFSEPLVENQFCPYCGRSTWGSRIIDNSYFFRVEHIRSYKPAELKTFMCHSCRQKTYKKLTQVVKLLEDV